MILEFEKDSVNKEEMKKYLIEHDIEIEEVTEDVDA